MIFFKLYDCISALLFYTQPFFMCCFSICGLSLYKKHHDVFAFENLYLVRRKTLGELVVDLKEIANGRADWERYVLKFGRSQIEPFPNLARKRVCPIHSATEAMSSVFACEGYAWVTQWATTRFSH